MSLKDIKDEFISFVCRYVKCFCNPKLIVKMVLAIILLRIHGYTDSVTDNRWALYDWDNLLCVDTFVVTACLIMMMLMLIDYLEGFKRYMAEEKIRAEAEDKEYEEYNLAEYFIQQLETYRRENENKIVNIEEFKRK